MSTRFSLEYGDEQADAGAGRDCRNRHLKRLILTLAIYITIHIYIHTAVIHSRVACIYLHVLLAARPSLYAPKNPLLVVRAMVLVMVLFMSPSRQSLLSILVINASY